MKVSWVTRPVSDGLVKIIESAEGMDEVEFPAMPRALADTLIKERNAMFLGTTLEQYKKTLDDTSVTNKPCGCGD